MVPFSDPGGRVQQLADEPQALIRRGISHESEHAIGCGNAAGNIEGDAADEHPVRGGRRRCEPVCLQIGEDLS